MPSTNETVSRRASCQSRRCHTILERALALLLRDAIQLHRMHSDVLEDFRREEAGVSEVQRTPECRDIEAGPFLRAGREDATGIG